MERLWLDLAEILEADSARSRREAERHAEAVEQSIASAAYDHWEMGWLTPMDWDDGEG